MSTDASIEALIRTNRSAMHSEILEWIEASDDGLTLFEVMLHTQRAINTLSGRLAELREDGQIKDSGRTRTYPESGKEHTVWVLGDDSHIVREQQVAKLKAAADRLGYDIAERKAEARLDEAYADGCVAGL